MKIYHIAQFNANSDNDKKMVSMKKIDIAFQMIKIANKTNENRQVKHFLNNTSASIIHNSISYLFFLNRQGRYIADAFLIEYNDDLYLTAPKNILSKLIEHLSTIDFRKELQLTPSNLMITYTQTKQENAYQDPRLQNGYFIIHEQKVENLLSKNHYDQIIIENEIAEFEDFESERSIILEFGKVAQFISHTKGCYPGQELMHRTHALGTVRKTVQKTNKNNSNIIKTLKENDREVLALIKNLD